MLPIILFFAGVPLGSTPPAPDPVIGGSQVAACGWASCVQMGGGCSGTLVHPEVIVYAAHCGTAIGTASLGDEDTSTVDIPLASCEVNPIWDGEGGGTDIAYCLTQAPVADVAIAPVLIGCEFNVLAPGLEVTTVGWGNTPALPGGTKHEITYTVDEYFEATNIVLAGGDDEGSLCSGDSGGGTYVRYFDGSWRFLAVSSAVNGTPCTDAQAVLAPLAPAVPWIEQATGIDITPCNDADGTWNPGPDCTDFPLDPGAGGGTWPNCDAVDASGLISSCGPPAGGPDDVTAPTIEITFPSDGVNFPLDGDDVVEVEVLIDVEDEEWGVAETRMQINGEDLPGSEDDYPPYELPPFEFPEGTWTLTAVALDWGANEAISAPVTITVGEPPSAESTGADETGQGSSSSAEGTTGGSDDDVGSTTDVSGSDGSSGGRPGQSDGGDGGCGCGHRSSAGWLVVLPLLSLRRRRR